MGEKWKEKIDKALKEADIAILLVSVDFIVSDFVNDVELPVLLEQYDNGNLTIIPIIVSSCRASLVINDIKWINDSTSPLDLMSKGKQEEILLRLAEQVEKIYLSKND